MYRCHSTQPLGCDIIGRSEAIRGLSSEAVSEPIAILNTDIVEMSSQCTVHVVIRKSKSRGLLGSIEIPLVPYWT